MKHFRLATCIGHRGVPQLCVENSVACLRLAAQLGYQWCEIDTQASADGTAVVYHDFELPDGTLLSDLPAARLVGRMVGEDARGQRAPLPTLHDCLTVAAESSLALVVEIKARSGTARQNVEAALAALRTAPKLEYMISSFNPEVLTECARLLPEAPLAINVDRIPARLPPECSNVHCSARHADAGTIRHVLAAGLGVYAWTVNDEQLAARLLADGVHGFFTDNADLFKRFG